MLTVLQRLKTELDLWSVVSFIVILLILLSSLHIFINLLQPANDS